MNRRNAPKFTVLLLLVMMLVLSMTSSVIGQAQPAGQLISPEGRGTLTLAELNAVSSQSVTMADGRIQVIVTLEGDAAVNSFIAAGGRSNEAAADTAARTRRGEIFAQQASFIGTARATFPNLSVITSSQYLVNTVTVAVSRGDVAALAALPGVRRVSANRIVQRDDTTSVPFIGAPSAWEGFGDFGALTGDGQVIAIVDTGIDYTHLHFGGGGDYSIISPDTDLTDPDLEGLFPAPWDATNGLSADGAPKVIGGWDFVGNAYNANIDGSVPAPDPNPLDCAVSLGGGHGSHVAGTAAGWGVAEGNPATTYAGPFNDSIFTGFPNITPALRIGPGVAPRAGLLALRVFGCEGSTDTSNVIAAFEAATSGEVVGSGNTVLAEFPKADVINMSLGSGFGDGAPGDPSNVASEAAAAAGINFVGSAGNSGDIFFITGSPSTGNSSISVANTTDTSAVVQGSVTRTSGTGAPVIYGAALGAFGPQDIAVVAEDVVYAVPANGCTPLTNAAEVAGKAVLIDRGGCEFSQKGNSAFAAGASALIVANNLAGLPFTMGNGTVAPIVEGYNLPSVMISLDAGNDLKANLPAVVDITANFDIIVGLADTPDRLVASSSRGPVRNNFDSFKPNVAAPGDSITSARAGGGDQIYVIGGTSMAAPHIAGVVALLREAYPTWGVEEIKALVINTATNDITTPASVAFPPQRVGSGRVSVENALSSEVIAYNAVDSKGVSVSFGFPEIIAGETLVDTRDITVENKGTDSVTYDVSFIQRSDMATTNVAFSVAPAQITVAAGTTATVTVTLTANPNVANVHANSDPTLSVVSSTRHRLTEESGLVVLTPTTESAVLRVPVYAAPRVHSDMAATAPVTLGATLGSAEGSLAGDGVITGATANDILSVVTFSELIASDPDEPNTPGNADLQYFGITSDYPVDDEDFGTTFFSFATYGEWSTLNEIGFSVYLDLDQDGAEDFIVTNGSSGGNLDQFAIGFIDVNNAFGLGAGAFLSYPNRPNGVSANLNTYVHLNNVVVFPMFTEDLNTLIEDDDSTEFNYWVETESARFDGIVDTVGSKAAPLSYDPENPALSFSNPDLINLPAWADLDGEPFTVDFNLGGLNPVPQILVLHHHNEDGNRAELLTLTVDETVRFNLLTPPDGAVLNSVAAIEGVNAITWEESAGATEYEFALERPGGLEDVVLDELTPEADDDGLECATGTCTLDVDGVIETLLTVNGLYSWTVNAFNDDGIVQADNNPFTFTVAVPAPVAFDLLAPGSSDYASAPVVTDPAAVVAITWDASDADVLYTFSLFKLSSNTRLGLTELADLTPVEDADLLTCDATVCTLNVDSVAETLLTDGRFAWTVVAENDFDSTEATNAPFFFIVNTGDIELVDNGGFETAGATATAAQGWDIKRATNDVRKVNAEKAATGEAYIQFKGGAGENSKLLQKVELNPAYLALGGLGAGDELQASILARTNLTANITLVIKVRYSDPTAGANNDGRDKLTVNIVGPTTEYQAFSGTLPLDGETTKVKFEVNFKSTSGTLRVDDASLIRLSTVSGNSSLGNGGGDIIPLPPSSVGGRGN